MSSAKYELNGSTAVITLDNPPVNGLGYDLRCGIVAGIDKATADPAVMAVVLIGSDRAFSGGEQQMLTLCRTLMGDPDLIMIDEPTEGLAPKIVELVGQFLQEVRNRGISILLIEQKLAIALDISERLYLMGHGHIVFEGTPADLKNNEAIRKEWLEV